jgi:hypothetical protein
MGPTQAPALTALLDAFFAWYYRTYPVNATFIGVHDHDHHLPDFSRDGRARARREVEDLQARFRGLPDEPADSAERVDRRVVEGALDVQAWELTARHFAEGNPCVYTGEAIFGVLSLLLRPFAPVTDRLEAAASRLRAIPQLLAQGAEAVTRAPAAWTARAVRECDAALVLLDRGLPVFLQDEGADGGDLLRAAGEGAAAFRTFRAHLSDRVTDDPGGTACGPEAFAVLLRRGHFLPMDAAEVETYGRMHIEAATRRLRALATDLGLPDWRTGLGRLADVRPSVEAYYTRFGQIWEAAKRAADARGFVTWPDYPIRFVPQPRWVREAAPLLYFLFYRAPAAFDRVEVVDYLVTPIDSALPLDEQTTRLRAMNESTIKLNHVIHHAGLGHHVQNWNAYHRAYSRAGRVAAVDCASRIALFCGGTMAEGWACYATDLMEEAGFLTPLERLAHAHSYLRMAARAVADARLHTGGWTLEQAAAFYTETAALSVDAARAEAVKNSMFPGTATMYLCGTQAIHDLRRRLQPRAGFSLREFHDRLLSYGSLPVALVAEEMDRDSGGSA